MKIRLLDVESLWVSDYYKNGDTVTVLETPNGSWFEHNSRTNCRHTWVLSSYEYAKKEGISWERISWEVDFRMEVVDYDYNEWFVWIILSKLDGGHTIQACLNESGKLIPHDCGHNWGVCGEVNQPAFDEFGENRCMTMLFRYAKELIPVGYRI